MTCIDQDYINLIKLINSQMIIIIILRILFALCLIISLIISLIYGAKIKEFDDNYEKSIKWIIIASTFGILFAFCMALSIK